MFYGDATDSLVLKNSVVSLVGGTTLRCSGNSFATPYMTGICAMILGKHPTLTPFQLKSVLHATASNVQEDE